MSVSPNLPPAVLKRLPAGYRATGGAWFVFPEADSRYDSIAKVNAWLRAEDWYPQSFQDVVWYGDDGVGNFFGWRPAVQRAILWNPEDGEEIQSEGAVEELWQFVAKGF